MLVVLAGCGGHGAEKTTSSTTSAAPSTIHVRLTADSHHPRVGKPWHYEVRVTDAAGKPVPAKLHIQIVFNGAPVGQIGRDTAPKGVWQETIGADGNAPFPSQAKGIRLTFQAIATAQGQQAKAGYWIVVQ